MTLEEIRPKSEYLKPVFEINIDFFKTIVKNRDKMGDTLLNVGLDHNPNGIESTPWIDYFINELQFKHICVLELNQKNFLYHKNFFKNYKNVDIVHGDVRLARNYFSQNSVDSAFWWSGPEHVYLNTLWLAFANLFSVVKKCCMFGGCPWGENYTLDPNFYHSEEDLHKYYPRKEHFEPFGFDIICSNPPESSPNAYLSGFKFFDK